MGAPGGQRHPAERGARVAVSARIQRAPNGDFRATATKLAPNA